MAKEDKVARGRRLYKRRTTMEVLNTSLSMVKRLESSGRLKKIRLGSRDVYHLADEVDALVAQQAGE